MNAYMLKQLKKARNLGCQEGIQYTIENYSAAILLCLKDKFDFTTEQLIEVSGYINDTFDSICEGYLDLKDIELTLKEENNIDIMFINSGAVNR